MHRARRRLVLTFAGPLALAALAATAPAQDAPTRTVTGTVRDSSGVPIPFVNVDGPRGLRALGDHGGQFRIVLPTHDATSLTLRRLGFQPVTLALPAGADTTVSVHLTLIAQQLSAVRVVTAAIETLRNRGFYDRMTAREQGLNTGQFITAEEIERRNASRPTQLLEGRMSVYVRRAAACQSITKCWVVTGPNKCVMTVLVDGQRLHGEGRNALYSSTNNPIYIDDLVSPSSIAGIEIYPRRRQRAAAIPDAQRHVRRDPHLDQVARPGYPSSARDVPPECRPPIRRRGGPVVPTRTPTARPRSRASAPPSPPRRAAGIRPGPASAPAPS